MFDIVSFIPRAVMQAIPLMLGCTGETITEKSGNLNLGTAGIMYVGGICGVAGLLLVGAINHTVSTTLAGGQGFTAVMVSWLAHFNPLTMVLSSGLLIFLGTGANELATSCGLNASFGDILTGVLIFCIIGSEFFINYQLHFVKKHKEDTADV